MAVMLFNSWSFLTFFPLVVAGYYLLPHRFRWAFLLFASYWFYISWEPEYVLLIAGSTLVDYLAGKYIHKSTNQRVRNTWLGISVVVNLGVLFFFKYFNFFSENVEQLFSAISITQVLPDFDLLLPVGISFYTFQSLSYTIDIYRKKLQPETHLGKFAVYISFFPQLVAGPIERAGSLLPQLSKKIEFNYNQVVSGLLLMAWGFFKKMVIADRLAVLVDGIYGNPTEYSSLFMLIATLAFTYQIYCDFSGYTDIARGAARVLGINLMKNFNHPYAAKSVADFWRRWHISLSSWLKDYVYIPLGGSQAGIARWISAIMLTFLLSGIWHGAGWTFIIWGVLHGAAIVYERISKPLRDAIATRLQYSNWSQIRSAITLSATFLFVAITWALFRAQSLTDGWYIISSFPSGIAQLFTLSAWSDLINTAHQVFHFTRTDGIIALLALALLEGIQWLQRRGKVSINSIRKFKYRWVLYYILVLTIAIFGKYSETAFVYFQF